ncbi:MAG: hypothetical protein ACTHOH_09970 [Lysobacteraceae bacterium]
MASNLHGMSRRSALRRVCLDPIRGGPNWLMAISAGLMPPALLLMLPALHPDPRDPHGGMFVFAVAAGLLGIALAGIALGGVWRLARRLRGALEE